MSDTYMRTTLGATVPRPHAVGAASRLLLKNAMDRRAAGVAAALGALGVGAYFLRYEGGAANLYFVCSATLLIAATIVLLTRRILPATVLTIAIIVVVDQASAVKRQAMDMVVHAYDLVFYLSSLTTLRFLWSEYRLPLAVLIAALVASAALAVLAYHLDATRISRRHAFRIVLLFALSTALAAHIKGERRPMQHYRDDLVISSFYSSWADTVETLWRGQLFEAAPGPSGELFALPTRCDLRTKPPHIILIHQESVVPPEYFPQVSYDTSLDRHFRSDDGELHKMRVETYGGGSWLTEFSILTGLSTYPFGGMRPFVQSLMGAKVHDTLPRRLAQCGYRNVVLYALDRNFVSYGKFRPAVGLPEVLDMHDQGAKTVKERDRFYYANAMDLMERHVQASRQPLFTYIHTMATHGSYDSPYMPEVNVPGGGPGTDREMSEYLRRLEMARMDYDALKMDLARRFPTEQFLIMRYGDHQPSATRSYLGYGREQSADDVTLPKESLGFLTYYTVEGVNYTPPPLPKVEVLDVPYLGTVLMEAAGLPLSSSYHERRRLMILCEGKYDGCEDRRQILTFHRRLIDSGLVDAR